MKNKSQLLKGCLEGCVLKVIESKNEIYGYDILKILNENGFSDVTEGTLYPMYTRLQKQKFLSFKIKKSPLGPSRKYYSLTDEGKEYLKEFTENWNYISKKVNKILKK
ncbi:PadR family transcriptional regulator [Clostridium sp. BJN0001]|uniref:PadR family transcriptional regulator n=1 Tax=Clostridium sp. BJN0001 TaxID=2930219 RepID=UPI001FD42138|nr:PadR family transcriptional regulator [Clostridium sp. BJN0001]